MSDRDFLQELRRAFRHEAHERLESMRSMFTDLEDADTDPNRRARLVEDLFRETHSLKGAARTIDAPSIETLCQSMEEVFAQLKIDPGRMPGGFLDEAHKALDHVESSLSRLETDHLRLKSPETTELIQSLTAMAMLAGARGARTAASRTSHSAPPPAAPSDGEESGPASETAASPPQQPAAASAIGEVNGWSSGQAPSELQAEDPTVRLPAERLSDMIRGVEELLATRHAAHDIAADLRALLKKLTPLLADSPENTAHVHALQNLAGRVDSFSRTLSGQVDLLLDDMKQALTQPFASLLRTMPRIIRNLARDSGKSVGIKLHGGQIVLDRRILDELRDPFIHLLRNAVDHGMLTPQERKARGKPESGTITVDVDQPDADRVRVSVSDDGEGIDPDRVRASAVKNGFASPAEVERLSDAQTLELVSRSGLSTSPIITDISGRGLGLAIVRDKVERLGGVFAISSEPGSHTRIEFTLPLTLSSYRAIVVSAGGQSFVLPKQRVEQVVRFDPEDTEAVRRVDGRRILERDGEALPLADLADILGLIPVEPATGGTSPRRAALLLASGRNRVAVGVDELLGEQDIMVKGLGSQLRRVRNIAGLTILGSGSLCPILHVPDLLQSALSRSTATDSAAATPAKKPAARRVLVAEDSITSRTLLKNVLESSGYQVLTAVDGLDAFGKLAEFRPDIVISDVQMPRLDGFRLTERIREVPEFAHLPVVLVTSLDSSADKERGVEAGANAYIVKSRFDQGNLLEVMAKLV